MASARGLLRHCGLQCARRRRNPRRRARYWGCDRRFLRLRRCRGRRAVRPARADGGGNGRSATLGTHGAAAVGTTHVLHRRAAVGEGVRRGGRRNFRLRTRPIPRGGQRLAARIASLSPTAVRVGKRILDRIEWVDLRKGYEFEQAASVRMSGHPDSKEALTAFRERRKSRYQPLARPSRWY